jgi:hypothetical protein
MDFAGTYVPRSHVLSGPKVKSAAQQDPATGRPNAALLGGHMYRWPFGLVGLACWLLSAADESPLPQACVGVDFAMPVEKEPMLGVERLGPGVLLEDPQVSGSFADRQIYQRPGHPGAAMPGSHVQAHELKGRGARLIALSPTDDADHRLAGLGKGDPASARHQPATPADLTVLDADTVEILPRNQVAVGLLPTLGLKRSDGSNSESEAGRSWTAELRWERVLPVVTRASSQRTWPFTVIRFRWPSRIRRPP